MKNILKIRNNNPYSVDLLGGSTAVFSETYPGLFNFYVNLGSDGSFISSYWSQDLGYYMFLFGDALLSYLGIEFDGNHDVDDFEFNEEITTQINQALWTNPGGGVVDITDLPVFEKYEMLAIDIDYSSLEYY